jgi:hypothetical protein
VLYAWELYLIAVAFIFNSPKTVDRNNRDTLPERAECQLVPEQERFPDSARAHWSH